MFLSIDYCPPCYPGSMTLPPVICRSYTGRKWAGLEISDLRASFVSDFAVGTIDAPNFIPGGSHRAPNVTINGLPVIETPGVIFQSEVSREARRDD